MYSAGWTAYPQCGAQCFQGDDHGTATAGATATFTVEGTRIALLSARDAGNGIAGVSLDGRPEAMIDYYLDVRRGEQIV